MPTPIQVLTAEDVREIARQVVRELGGARGPVEHSQRDGERPAGARRDLYLQAWRALNRAGDPDVRAEGRARIMSADAWARFVASGNAPQRKRGPRLVTCGPSPLAANASTDDIVLEQLGGRRRRP